MCQEYTIKIYLNIPQNYDNIYSKRQKSRLGCTVPGEVQRQMHNEFENEDDNWRPEKSKIRKILERSFSVGFVVLVFAVIGFMCLRLILSKPPKTMRQFLWTESAVAAYEESDGKMKITKYPSTDSFSEDSMYSISQITYVEPIGQFQATVRYNLRALEHLKENKGVDIFPEGEIFVFLLRDNFGKVYSEYLYTQTEKSGYGYRHVIFDGVSMTDITTITLEIYYIGDVGDKESAVAELYMYRYDYAPQIYYYDPPKGVNTSLMPAPGYTKREQ